MCVLAAGLGTDWQERATGETCYLTVKMENTLTHILLLQTSFSFGGLGICNLLYQPFIVPFAGVQKRVYVVFFLLLLSFPPSCVLY